MSQKPTERHPPEGVLLLLTSSYPTDDDDYRGLFVKRFAEQLCSAGRNVEVIAPAPGGPHSQQLRSLSDVPADVPADIPGLNVHWLGQRRAGATRFGQLYGGDGLVNNLRQRPTEIRHLVPSMRAMGAAIRERADKIDAVVAHWLMPAGLVAALAKARHRSPSWPLWIVCHSGGVRALAYLPKPLRHRFGALLARHADLLTCVTAELRQRLLTLVGPVGDELRDRCRILPMGVDTKRFESATPSPNGPIVVVARLTRLKGVDRLLRAASRLGVRVPVKVVGDGPERSHLEHLASSLQLKVEFIGALPPEAVPRALDGCAIAALPSRRLRGGRTEGLPTFALEALATGLPLVTTTCWEMPTSLAATPGIFRVDDSEAGVEGGLETALEYVGRQSDGDAAQRVRAVREFDWSKIGARSNERISELV